MMFHGRGKDRTKTLIVNAYRSNVKVKTLEIEREKYTMNEQIAYCVYRDRQEMEESSIQMLKERMKEMNKCELLKRKKN